MQTPKRIVHVIAQCQKCAWTADDYKTAARAATIHNQQIGHSVHVEQGRTYTVKS